MGPSIYDVHAEGSCPGGWIGEGSSHVDVHAKRRPHWPHPIFFSCKEVCDSCTRISSSDGIKSQWRAEGLGCPGQWGFWMPTNYKNGAISVPIHVENFWRPFLVISQNVINIFPVISANYLPKILTTFFSPLSGCPLILDAGAGLHFLRIYPYFFHIYLCIFQKTPSLDAPGL